MDFQTVAKNYSLLKNVPYAKVKILKYSADKPWSVEYKTEFSSEWKLENIFNYNTRHQNSNNKKMANHIKFVQLKLKKKKRNLNRKSERSKINLKVHATSRQRIYVIGLTNIHLVFNVNYYQFLFAAIFSSIDTLFLHLFFLNSFYELLIK